MLRKEDIEVLAEQGNLIGFCYYDLFVNQPGKNRPVLLIPEEGQFASTRCLAIPLSTNREKFFDHVRIPIEHWAEAGLTESGMLAIPKKRKLGKVRVYSLRHDSHRISTRGGFLLVEELERPEIVAAIAELRRNIRLGEFELHRR